MLTWCWCFEAAMPLFCAATLMPMPTNAITPIAAEAIIADWWLSLSFTLSLHFAGFAAMALITSSPLQRRRHVDTDFSFLSFFIFIRFFTTQPLHACRQAEEYIQWGREVERAFLIFFFLHIYQWDASSYHFLLRHFFLHHINFPALLFLIYGAMISCAVFAYLRRFHFHARAAALIFIRPRDYFELLINISPLAEHWWADYRYFLIEMPLPDARYFDFSSPPFRSCHHWLFHYAAAVFRYFRCLMMLSMLMRHYWRAIICRQLPRCRIRYFTRQRYATLWPLMITLTASPADWLFARRHAATPSDTTLLPRWFSSPPFSLPPPCRWGRRFNITPAIDASPFHAAAAATLLRQTPLLLPLSLRCFSPFSSMLPDCFRMPPPSMLCRQPHSSFSLRPPPFISMTAPLIYYALRRWWLSLPLFAAE